MLRVLDPDSSPEDLEFSCLGGLNNQAGHLEHQDYPGKSISSFSLVDLEEGKVDFVHTGAPTSRLALRVSDGQKVSNTVVLRIMAVSLEHQLVNNTGLEVEQGGAAIITGNQLAVRVNVADQGVEIRYDVTEAPRYGELQRLHSSDEWKATGTFSQKLLEKERLRYRNTQGGAADHFTCRVTIGTVVAEEGVVIAIAIRLPQFKVTRSKMEVAGVRRSVLTSEDLRAVARGVKLRESDVFFRLRAPPKKGRLLLDRRVLERSSTFSQKNVSDGLVSYELREAPGKDTRDSFSFQVFSTHHHHPGNNSTHHDFRVNIRAQAAASGVSLVNKGLSVLEGGSKVITMEMLFTHAPANREVRYVVTAAPRHGRLRRINVSNSSAADDSVAAFTNRDIADQRLMYVHDDSETKLDSFEFSVGVYKPQRQQKVSTQEEAEEKHTFNISVELRPVRVVDKVFHVARDGQRLLTVADLRFRDGDSDFEDGWLVYTRRGIPLGELVSASDSARKLYEFTQHDLEQGKVVTLTSANLSVLTNLDVRHPQEVTYEVYLPPRHGVLFLKAIVNSDEVTVATGGVSTFTGQHLSAGLLAYRHDDSLQLSDGFNVTARVKEREREEGRRRTGEMLGAERGVMEVHLDIGVVVRVYLESHQRPPTVLTKRPLVVEEGNTASISRDFLETPGRGAEGPGDQTEHNQGDTQQPITSFSQDDLNRGRISYRHQTTGGTNDSLLLAATNGVTEVGPITLEIDVIPKLLPLQVSGLTLDEGSSQPLTLDIIKVTNHHFRGLNFLYELEREYISYIHDGSDTLSDNFTIRANQTESKKHSGPAHVSITITPVNDETPTVTVNRVLK
ncbi:hypothetical protein CRUP_019259, partial [Coryphaenoides rupestris]